MHCTTHTFKDSFEIWYHYGLEQGWKSNQFLRLPSSPKLFHIAKFEVLNLHETFRIGEHKELFNPDSYFFILLA